MATTWGAVPPLASKPHLITIWDGDIPNGDAYESIPISMAVTYQAKYHNYRIF
jgi:hypothetical protein